MKAEKLSSWERNKTRYRHIVNILIRCSSKQVKKVLKISELLNVMLELKYAIKILYSEQYDKRTNFLH